MLVFIKTKSLFKFAEFQKYFKNIGVSANLLKQPFTPPNEDYLIISEQTSLLDINGKVLTENQAQACTHHSTIWIKHIKNNPKSIVKKEYKASVEGFIFPFLKQESDNVYGWDDIFCFKKYTFN